MLLSPSMISGRFRRGSDVHLGYRRHPWTPKSPATCLLRMWLNAELSVRQDVQLHTNASGHSNEFCWATEGGSLPIGRRRSAASRDGAPVRKNAPCAKMSSRSRSQHTPHELFVKLDELVRPSGERDDLEWRETAGVDQIRRAVPEHGHCSGAGRALLAGGSFDACRGTRIWRVATRPRGRRPHSVRSATGFNELLPIMSAVGAMTMRSITSPIALVASQHLAYFTLQAGDLNYSG